MSVVEATPARASTMCRRDDHRLCATAQAHCGCSCHGTRGQQPPTKEPVMPQEATVTPIKPEGQFRCEEHDQSFATPQGLGAHRRHVHGKAGTPPRAKVAPNVPHPPRRPPPKVVEVPERQALAALAGAYSDICGADVATSIDSAGDLLDAIERHGWVLVERP